MKIIGLLAIFIGFVSYGQENACDFSLPSSRDGSWSPDGEKIIFDSNRSGKREIYLMDSDGSNVLQLTNGGPDYYYPEISPDGSKVVFFTYENRRSWILVMDIDGSGRKEITTSKDSTAADASWSHDGKRIIFFSERTGNAEIYTMNSDGSDWRQLTNHPAGENTPMYSPDGSKILFISDREGVGDVFVMNSDGSGIRNLTQSLSSDRVARWSPDGKSIIFYTRPKTSDTVPSAVSWSKAEIVVINSDGSGRRNLTDNNFADHGPVYSPDGKKILFTSCRSGNRELWVMNADGSNPVRLTFSR